MHAALAKTPLVVALLVAALVAGGGGAATATSAPPGPPPASPLQAVAQPALDVVTVSVDRGAPTGVFDMVVGHTHTQRSLERDGDAAAIASGRALLSQAVDIQNQHLYGWGTLNPNPSPGVYDWGSLDRRVQLMRDTGGTPVITLCCAPDWMTELGTETTTYANRPPTARHYADFADLARRAAERYPDVRHFVVWNEMKGFWNAGSGQWDYVAYTNMYNAVHDALKAVDPAIQVGGPYLVIESTGSNPNGGWVTQMPVTRRNEVVLEYWLEHGNGADFVAIDRKVKDYHDTRRYSPAETMALTANFDTVARQVGDMTGLPVWFIEQHVVGQRGGPVHFQAAGIASMLYHQLNGGAVATVGWKPEQAQPQGTVQENLFTSTQVAGGGQRLPTYWSYRFFNESFAPGTPRYDVTTSDPLVLALASDAATVVINQRPEPITIDLDGTTHALDGYEVARFDAAGQADGSSTDAVGDDVAQPSAARSGGAGSDATTSMVTRLSDAEGGEILEIEPSGPLDAAPAPAESLAEPASSPSVVWLDQIGTDQADRVNAVAADGKGVVAAGASWGEVVAGRHRGLSDGLVRRYRSDGTVHWTNQFGSPTHQSLADVAVDHRGTYAVGTTDGPVAGQAHAGAFDALVRAYDRSGRVRWTRQLGTTGNDNATEVLAHRGVVYVVGHTDGTFPGQVNAGSQDAFIAAYTPAGNLLWTRQYGTVHPDFFTDVVADGDHLVVSGTTAGSFAGQPALGHWDALVARMTVAGDLVWAWQFGSPWDDRALAVAVTDDGIRVAGRAEDALDGSTFGGVYDAYVRALGRDGTAQWTTMLATPFFDRVQSIATDRLDTHLIGRTTGTMPGQSAVGADDVFLASLDGGGTVGRLEQLGTAAVDEPTSITTDGANRYVGGTTRGAFDGHTNGGGRDGFLARLVPSVGVLASDVFNRTTTGSWGVPAAGGGWQVWPRSAMSVDGGRGNMAVVGGTGERRANLPGVDGDDVSLRFDIELDRLPSGGSAYVYALARKSPGNEYRARLRIRPNGTISMRVIRRAGGSWQPLGTNVEVPGLVVSAGEPFEFQFDVEDTGGGVRLRAAAWEAGTSRPAWPLVVTDGAQPRLGAGSIALSAMAPSASTSVAVSFDDFSLVER